MHTLTRALFGASLLALAAPAAAEDDRRNPKDDILIVAQKQQADIEKAPASASSITADRIATTVNAMNVEDALKYLPSLIVRKRHIGDTQAPLATRTSGLGASARSLIYADGALLSALIGNNNTLASPRWSLVSPQEVARIDVLYGPFSAAYPGNSIGAVVNITTRLPDRLEASVTAGVNAQRYSLYGTRDTLPAYRMGATIGDRFGPLALFASYDHVASDSQPTTFTTGIVPATRGSANPVTGGYDDVNRTGGAIRVFGAGGIEHQLQDRVKLKAALDITDGIRLTYVGGLFLNDTDSSAETYLTSGATGLPFYAGNFTNQGRPYSLAANAFSNGTYRYDERHWSHALSATGAGARFDWQLVGTLYDFDRDVQRMPTTALPAAREGGAGTITRLDGTGWQTLDAKAAWRSDDSATHTISAGGHYDRFELASDRFATTDWLRGGEGALVLQSRGKTRTAALWAQDAWKLLPGVTLTAGGRYEWWRAYDGRNFSASPAIAADQPRLRADKFSPKATLAWAASPALTLRASFGKAYRFPTVGELYQIVTTPVPAVPNPDLRPERSLSEELAIEHRDAHGSGRIALFNEVIDDALISQSGPLNGTAVIANFVQNVDRTRARGVEAAVERSDVLPRIDLSGSVTYTDAETRRDTAFPAAEGRMLPTVPRWKATLVGTWRPSDAIALTAAGRYSSRLYGTLDNSDVVGNTYFGFYKYLVVDLRAVFRVGDHYEFGLGVDNVNDDRYFLFHPFPQRSFHVDLTWRL